MELELEEVSNPINLGQDTFVSTIDLFHEFVENLKENRPLAFAQLFCMLCAAYCSFMLMRKLVFRPLLYDWAHGKRHKH